VLNVTNAALFPDTSGSTVAEGSSTNFVFGWSGTNRTLKVAPGTNQFGTNVVWIRVSDGTNSVTSTQTVAVATINDAPSFTVGANVAVTGTNGTARTITGWASNISAGPSNESAQTLTFFLTAANANYFTLTGKPAVNSSGTLTFTPKPGTNGPVNVNIYLKDSVGAVSATNTFSITVTP